MHYYREEVKRVIISERCFREDVWKMTKMSISKIDDFESQIIYVFNKTAYVDCIILSTHLFNILINIANEKDKQTQNPFFLMVHICSH